MQQITKYFVTGHTAEGFVNYLSSNLVGIQKIVVLQHPSNVIKTKVLNELITLYEQEHAIELICSPQSKTHVAGFIIRSLSLAMLADDLEEVLDDTQVKYIQLDDYIVASTQNEDQTNVKQEVSRLLERAYPYFKAGLEIHDQLEEVFINEMDFEKADKIAEKFIESLFKSVAPQRRQSIVYERLFGTNTPDGFVNHLEGLIEPIGKRFFIKGRAGTGKSFFMNKVLKECKLRGLDVELYRCSFDPNSIDMLIIRQLNTCLFDSTPPHELFPSRQTDEVIDFYEKTVTSGTDELYANQIEQLTRDYKAEMNNGMKEMKAIKQIEERTEKVWRKVRKEKIQSVIKKI